MRSHATVEKKKIVPCRGNAELKRYYNHISSFKNETQMNKTTLVKYVWEQKQRHNITICAILFQYYEKLHVMPTRKVWNSDLPKPRRAIEQKIRTCF